MTRVRVRRKRWLVLGLPYWLVTCSRCGRIAECDAPRQARAVATRHRQAHAWLRRSRPQPPRAEGR